MSERFLEESGDLNSFNPELEIDVEYKEVSHDILKSPLYHRGSTWLDSAWSQKVLNIITNPIIIIATILICSTGILILGGYK